MSGIYVGFGRIIGVRSKTAEEMGTEGNLLEMSVSVDTGERKKEGQQYAPSNIFSIPVWGKRADALSPYVEEGKHVFFKGHLAQPNAIIKDGEAKAYLKIVDVDELKVVNVVYGDSASNEERTEAPATTTKSVAKAKSAAKKKNDEMFIDDPDLADLDFGIEA